MGPAMSEKPDRTYSVPDTHTRPGTGSHTYHSQAAQASFSILVEGPGMPDSEPLFQDIYPLLTSSDREIRMMAITALGTSGDHRAVEPLFRACMDEDDLVKHAAYEALTVIAAKLR